MEVTMNQEAVSEAVAAAPADATIAMSEFIAPIAVFLIIGWLVNQYLAHRRWNRAADIHSSLQTKLLDKFGSTNEILTYLESDAGSAFLESATTVQADPYRRILTSIQAGIALALAGLAFVFLSGRISGGEEGLTVLGTLGLALGLGFLISGVISHRLSRSWGLINGKKTLPGPNPGPDQVP
jgi:hypothetical protein